MLSINALALGWQINLCACGNILDWYSTVSLQLWYQYWNNGINSWFSYNYHYCIYNYQYLFLPKLLFLHPLIQWFSPFCYLVDCLLLPVTFYTVWPYFNFQGNNCLCYAWFNGLQNTRSQSLSLEKLSLSSTSLLKYFFIFI